MAKSTSTVLIAILLIFTFPIWIGLAGGIFGLIAGLFGAVIGIIGAIFGAIGGAIGSVFSGIGWFFNGIFDWDYNPFWHMPRFCTLLLIILVVVLISKSRSQKT